jgi:hypothetical protein
MLPQSKMALAQMPLWQHPAAQSPALMHEVVQKELPRGSIQQSCFGASHPQIAARLVPPSPPGKVRVVVMAAGGPTRANVGV